MLNPTKEAMASFESSISTWRNAKNGGSRVVQIFLELIQLAVSQYYLLLDLVRRGKDVYVHQSSPDWWLLKHGLRSMRQFSFYPEFVELGESRVMPSLQIFANFMLRINKLSTEAIVDGLKYRFFILIHHVSLPQGHASFKFHEILKAFISGMSWETYDYEYMCGVFPHASTRPSSHSVCLAISMGLSQIQDLSDYCYSIMLSNYSGRRHSTIRWETLKNDHYSSVFKLLCSPTEEAERYGMADDTYHAYMGEREELSKKKVENIGNFMESLLSFILVELNDLTSALLIYILVMRFQDGEDSVSDCARNLRHSSIIHSPLNTVVDPEISDPSAGMWRGKVQYTITHLFEIGLLRPQRSWWLRWLFRAFHGIDHQSALGVDSLPSFNAGKIDVGRSEAYKKRQKARRQKHSTSDAL